jgi:hypothetical protein
MFFVLFTSINIGVAFSDFKKCLKLFDVIFYTILGYRKVQNFTVITDEGRFVESAQSEEESAGPANVDSDQNRNKCSERKKGLRNDKAGK